MGHDERWGHAPFGVLEQRELAYLRTIGATAADVALLVTIRARQDGASLPVHDTIVTLASWSRMKPTTVKLRLAWLQTHGLIERRVERRAGGDRGQAWQHSITPLRIASWPSEEKSPTDPSSQEERSPDGPSSDRRGVADRPKRSRQTREERSPARGITQRANPDVFPVVDDDDDTYVRDAVVEIALRALREIPDLELDEDAARRDLVAIRRDRPRVHLSEQIEAWIERGQEKVRGDPQRALMGWLRNAPDSATEELASFCRRDGCEEVATRSGVRDPGEGFDELWCDAHGRASCGSCGYGRDVHEPTSGRCRLIGVSCSGFVDARVEQAS